MASRRVLGIVAACAAVAVAAVIGGTLLLSRGESTTLPGAVTRPRPGYPRLELSFALRTDPQARALFRAETLYNGGNVAAAAPIFAHYHSLEAQLGAAFAAWKSSGLAGVEAVAAAHPADPAAQLNLGIADFQAGRDADAVSLWEKTAREHADTPYGVAAETLLHPKDIPGLPLIVLPGAPARLPTAAQLAGLRRAAARPDEHAKLVYGYVLWAGVQQPLSAERQFAAAAKLAPNDPLAQALAAVGRFSKAQPVRAFAKLGPLTAVFPRSPAVEFHLAVLLLWIGENAKAAEHFRAAIADGPHAPYAEPARRLLASLGKR